MERRLLTQCSCLFVALLTIASNVCAARSQEVDLICFPISGGGGSDPIVRIHVVKNNGDWHIVHYSSKGKYYDRASQYWISDRSTHDSISWTGLLVNRNDVKMVGTVTEKNGAYFYKESVYNIHKADADVVENAASCVGRISLTKDEPPEREDDHEHSPVLAPSDATAQQRQPTVGGSDLERNLTAAKQRMDVCLKHFPTPPDGVWNALQVVLHQYVAACGKDYLALLEQGDGGLTREQGDTLAEMDAYQTLGCHVANIDLDEFQHTPDALYMLTCSAEHYVPSKAKWWLIVYAGNRVSFVSGPYDDMIKCGLSKEADAMLRENPRCELTAFPPFVGELALPPR